MLFPSEKLSLDTLESRRRLRLLLSIFLSDLLFHKNAMDLATFEENAHWWEEEEEEKEVEVDEDKEDVDEVQVEAGGE